MPPRNLDPNPVVANDLTGRTTAVTGTATRVTNLTSPWVRATAQRATATGAGALLLGAAHQPGGDLTGRVFSAWAQFMLSAVPAGDVYFYLACYNASGTQVGSIITAVTGLTADTPKTANVTGTAPSGTTRLNGALYCTGSASGLVLTLGGIRIDEVNDPALTYADGSTAGWAFDGATGNSTSTMLYAGSFAGLLAADPGPPANSPEHQDDLSGAANGALAGRVTRTGRTWIAYKDAGAGGQVPVILGGAIGPPSGHVPGQGGTGVAAGYATVGLSKTCRWVGCLVRWDSSSSDASSMSMGAFTIGALPSGTSGSANMHLSLSPTVLQFSVFDGGAQNFTTLTAVGGSNSTTLPAPMARDGSTLYRVDVFIDRPAATAYVNVAGNPCYVFTHPWIGSVAATYPYWEYYSVTGGTNLPRFVQVWADTA